MAIATGTHSCAVARESRGPPKRRIAAPATSAAQKAQNMSVQHPGTGYISEPQCEFEWSINMAIQIIDPKEIALRERKRTVVMNTRKLHAWVHYYPNPGDHDEMHCHNEDQVFTCFEGECTMRFPDGTSSVLRPGMAALITGGSFYQLENTGQGHMILMGHRSGNQDNVTIIDYATRKDIRKAGGPKMRNRAEAGRTSP